MSPTRLTTILHRFAGQHILVVGDVMLDHFLWGKVNRISPEAPVPVVEIQRESSFPGGAANVARNLHALGSRATVLGCIGADAAGQQLCAELPDHNLVVDSTRPTTVKTRIVAHHQQIVRFDKEQIQPLTPALQRQLLKNFQAQLPRVAAVIFEDYGKGVLTQPLLNEMQRRARRAGKITTADPNSRHLLRYTGLTGITPNRAEAFAAAGLTNTPALDDVLADDPLLRCGERLLQRWKPENLLITLGEHGMCLFRRGQKPHHIPTVAQEVFDVSGAGDTAIATLTLALAAGANAVEAAEIANHAAGIVVGKLGTATCSPAELAQSVRRHRHR
ncbi:MAG: Bifunctional protein HldE [Verrucomicrobiae bacterium]|nr:Bifunctional protein HldE [Verrucomicrobiae bacterium]